jgi:hypothetical protein
MNAQSQLPPFFAIKVRPTGQGLFDAYEAGGRLLVKSSRTPFFASARVLLAEGLDPATPIVLLTSDGTPSLSSTVGRAAGLSVSEGEHHGPRIVKHRPMPRNVLAIPTAPEEPAHFEPRALEGAN